MSESMSSPWIRDYLMDVAETYGAQLYNAPESKKKKRVQLTDVRSLLPHLPILTRPSSCSLIKKTITFGLGYPIRIIGCPYASQSTPQTSTRGQLDSPHRPCVAFSVLVTASMAATLSTLASSSFLSAAIALSFLRVLSAQMHPEIHLCPTYHLKSTMSL